MLNRAVNMQPSAFSGPVCGQLPAATPLPAPRSAPCWWQAGQRCRDTPMDALQKGRLAGTPTDGAWRPQVRLPSLCPGPQERSL